MSGLYIHIPFCKKACHYCDFHFSTQLDNRLEMIYAIAKEIVIRKEYLGNNLLESIYFGGGTPSLLTEHELNVIFSVIDKHFVYNLETEITLEANPDDISAEKLKMWYYIGINRLSIGLQSFNDAELQWMNRAHTAAESELSVKLSQDAGFDNLSIDLIYGSKFQTLKTWETSLTRAARLHTSHISSYNLTIEPQTVLGLKNKKGLEPSVNDEFSAQQFLMMSDVLASKGFEGYEISNFARNEKYAVHNSNYWLQKHYLGVGPSAHSFNGQSRQWNVKNNSSYIKAIESEKLNFENEKLTLNDLYNEYVLTRLRTKWGCDENEILENFGTEIYNHFKIEIDKIEKYISKKQNTYTLNENGKLMADGLAAGLFV
jgi:oxygen-independent coproporphyrinogen III oxidase